MFLDGKPFTEETRRVLELEGRLNDEPRDVRFGHKFHAGKVGACCLSLHGLKKMVASLLKGKRYLEVGTFDGLALAALAQDYPDREFYAIDIFEDGFATASGCLKYFLENCAGLPNVYLNIMTSNEFIHHDLLRFDFILIDGDHSREWVKNDILNLWPLLGVGGTMAFHDFDHQQVREGIKKAMPGLYERLVSFDGEFWFVKKGG